MSKKLGSPELAEHAEDDTAVKQRPTHHVDYLSHDWREEDIWSSWRYIVSKRGEYTNGPHLRLSLPDPNAEKANAQQNKSLEALLAAKNKRIMEELTRFRVR